MIILVVLLAIISGGGFFTFVLIGLVVGLHYRHHHRPVLLPYIPEPIYDDDPRYGPPG